MVAALGGDQAAYRALLAALAPHLRAYFTRRTGHADAEDLVQETLIAIHTKRATYDPSLPFTAWLHAIARYKLIDHFRRMKLRRTLPIEDAESVVAESFDGESVAARRDVERLLAMLPEKKRELVRQVKIEGLSTAEAAARSGISESAVKVGVHRALKALSAMIGRDA